MADNYQFEFKEMFNLKNSKNLKVHFRFLVPFSKIPFKKNQSNINWKS